MGSMGEWEAGTAPVAAPPDGVWYHTKVNKGSINMRWLAGYLNDERVAGYRLHTLHEIDGNTVIVTEWVGPPA